MGWYEFDQHAKTPAPQLVEEDNRVRLYDAQGRKIVREKRIGFRPPTEDHRRGPRGDDRA